MSSTIRGRETLGGLPYGHGCRLTLSLATDGGFRARIRQASEPEPMMLAALALDDAGARKWLVEHQRQDGSYSIATRPYVNDSAIALGALALGPGPERFARAQLPGADARTSNGLELGDPDRFIGDRFGIGRRYESWVEPTARALCGAGPGRQSRDGWMELPDEPFLRSTSIPPGTVAGGAVAVAGSRRPSTPPG